MIEFATVARPYAKALFELAEEKGQTENWLNGLMQAAWLVQQPNVALLIRDADLDSQQKADELIKLLDSDAVKSHEFKNFVHVTAQEKRLKILPEIYNQYYRLALAKNDTQQAVIYTAYDVVSEGQRAKIVSDLEQHFQTRLHADFITDANLIGGLKVVVGDQVLDLSVQGKLKQLHTTLTN